MYKEGLLNRRAWRNYPAIWREVIYCIILAITILIFNGCGFLPDSDDVSSLTVAVIGPFSGDLTDLGQSMRNGIVLATEEQNSEGGVLGRQVQLRLYDSACDYTIARDVTLQAIRDAGASYILGAVCSEASEGVAQVASDEGVLVLNPASVNEDLTLAIDGTVRPFVYRVPFIDPVQGSIAALLAINKLDVKTASILVAESGIYESSLADAFEETFTANDGEVVLRESYDRNEDSFYDVLSEVREVNAEIIYVPGYYDVVNKLAAQARLYGMNQILVGSDGWNSPDLDKLYLDNCYFTSHFFASDPRSVVIDWVKKYEKRYLIVPDTLATLSYDTAKILFDAIEQSGSLSPFDLAASIQNTTFNTVTGQIKFDEMHNPIKPVIILRIQNGNIVYDSRMDINDQEE